jgi:hypothetical protein
MLHDEELRGLYRSPSIFRIVGWVLGGMEEARNAYRILVGNCLE